MRQTAKTATIFTKRRISRSIVVCTTPVLDARWAISPITVRSPVATTMPTARPSNTDVPAHAAAQPTTFGAEWAHTIEAHVLGLKKHVAGLLDCPRLRLALARQRAVIHANSLHFGQAHVRRYLSQSKGQQCGWVVLRQRPSVQLPARRHRRRRWSPRERRRASHQHVQLLAREQALESPIKAFPHFRAPTADFHDMRGFSFLMPMDHDAND